MGADADMLVAQAASRLQTEIRIVFIFRNVRATPGYSGSCVGEGDRRLAGEARRSNRRHARSSSLQRTVRRLHWLRSTRVLNLGRLLNVRIASRMVLHSVKESNPCART